MEDNKKYDFIIVGAGLYGATCARLLTNLQYKCLIIEKSAHVGGMCYTETVNGIDVHKFGPHVFHTSNPIVWDFVNNYADFNNFRLNTLSYNKGKMYHLPFNMNTMYDIFGVQWPKDAAAIILGETEKYKKQNPANIEEFALATVGPTIYNTLIKPYTEKQWGMQCTQLPAEIIKRLPIRFTYDNNYFNDIWQGVPIDGYTKMIENIIGDDIDILLNKNFNDDIEKYYNLTNYIIYTGAIDEFCGYKFGPLKWRSLIFEEKDESEDNINVTGAAITNFADKDVPWTRMIEHKWFTPERQGLPDFDSHTIVSYEIPTKWEKGLPKYYPINDTETDELYLKYINFVKEYFPNMVFAGRLGAYRYYDMDDAIANAFDMVNNIQKLLTEDLVENNNDSIDNE